MILTRLGITNAYNNTNIIFPFVSAGENGYLTVISVYVKLLILTSRLAYWRKKKKPVHILYGKRVEVSTVAEWRIQRSVRHGAIILQTREFYRRAAADFELHARRPVYSVTVSPVVVFYTYRYNIYVIFFFLIKHSDHPGRSRWGWKKHCQTPWYRVVTHTHTYYYR